MDIKGALNVLREVVARRINLAFNTETLSAAKTLAATAQQYQSLSAASDQDCILPDATTISKGWSVTVLAAGAANISAKTYDATTPVLLQLVSSGDAYQFICTDNGTAAGDWRIVKLTSGDAAVSARHVATIADATTAWGAASGGLYKFTVLASSHGLATNQLSIRAEQSSGSDFIKIEPHEIKTLANGDVEVYVSEVSDGRFIGRVLIN